jgi:TRAP-type C4-dicarboxylate transport system substrate-binding protein
LEANLQALVDGEAKHLQTLKDAGVEIIPLSEEQKAKFVEASKPIYEQYANTPEAKEYIDAVNKLKK